MNYTTEISDELLINELKKRIEGYKQAVNRLNELNLQLIDVNKKLAESEALKSHFISNIANEIVNPFSAILGLANSIINENTSDLPRIKKMSALIYKEAFNLDFQLKNIFVAAEIEAGEITPQISQVNILEVIKGLLDSFKHEIDNKAIQINFPLPSDTQSNTEILFKTDSEKITIILSNLISNAIKFNNNQGKIDIVIQNKNKILTINVIDNGIGISAENQKIIFDRFKRLDNGINSLNRGHGLGLSINKALLEMLDGKITVKSSSESGTDFEIQIPESDKEVDQYSTEGNELFFGDDNEKF